MSIADELQNYADGLGEAYDAVDDMGGVTPPAKNMNNLDAAIRTIPQSVVNDGTLTIQKNGTTVQTFTANQASNATANITVPVNTSDLTNDSGFITSASLPTKTSDLTNDGSDGTSAYVEADDLATVATTGSYTDLTNTPSIPAAQVNSDWNANSGVAEILNKPNLATVATTGAYSDLSGTPTIPTVNDAILTITQNGTSAGTFTANASSNTTIALTDTTYSAMTGASSGAAGTSGLVPAPAAGDESKVLSGAGTWVNQSGGSTYTAGNGISISANDEISIDTSVVAELSDLPTVNDGTLTIQHNGTTKGTFTANQSSASTVNIETIYADDYIDTTSALPFVTTSMIENNAVTAAKIDWSSMPAPIVITTSSNITRNTSSAWATEDFYSEQKTFDAGKYLILAMFRIANSSSGDKWIDVKVGNTGDLCNQGFQSGTGAMQGVAAFDFIDIQTSGTYAVTFQAGSEANNAAMVLHRGSKIAFIKIG